MNDFYPVSEYDQIDLDDILNDENRGLYCLDWTNDLLIYSDNSYRSEN